MAVPVVAFSFDEDSGIVLNCAPTGAVHDFALGGASVIRVASLSGNGLRSTGPAVVELPDVAATPERTVMATLAFTGIPTSWPLLCQAPSIDSGAWGLLYLAPDICVQGRSNSALARVAAPWPADGQPHDVAGTYDGTHLRLYLDGVPQGAPVALAGPLRTDSDPPVLWSGTGTMSTGYVDNVRLFDVALTDGQVAAYAGVPVVYEPPLEPGPDPDPERDEPEVETGGWMFLGQTARWNAEEAERERSTPPVACPNCGTPLDTNSAGQQNCPFGDYRTG